MKLQKLITGLLFSLILTTNANAAGVYDGIWQMYYGNSFIGYNSIHQNGDQLIAIPLYTNNLSWEAVIGTLDSNAVTVNSIISDASYTIRVIFDSANSFTATQVACSPTYNCLLPNGAVLTGTKIW